MRRTLLVDVPPNLQTNYPLRSPQVLHCHFTRTTGTTMPTLVKAALKKWEETTGRKCSEATEVNKESPQLIQTPLMQVKLIGVYPPLEKMDGSVGFLTSCVKLSLSTNMITRYSCNGTILITTRSLAYKTYRT